MTNISESDLLIYYLAVEKKFYEILELYGLLYEHSRCKKCGYDNGLHYKIMKELLDSFSLKRGIKIPKEKDLARVSRDLTIWKGMTRYAKSENPHFIQAEEYAKRYGVKVDAVYKIRDKVQSVVEKFITLKGIFKGIKNEAAGK
jgi:hypothetical protein